MVPDGMPSTSKPLSPEFFINPRCPLGAGPVEAATIDVHPGEAMIAPEREVLLQSSRRILARRASIYLPLRLG